MPAGVGADGSSATPGRPAHQFGLRDPLADAKMFLWKTFVLAVTTRFAFQA